MAGNQRRIHGMFRYRAMAANALHFDMQRIGRSHHRAVAQADFAQFLARHVMQAKDGVAGEFCEQAIFDHHPSAVQQLFCRLEN